MRTMRSIFDEITEVIRDARELGYTFQEINALFGRGKPWPPPEARPWAADFAEVE